MARFASPTTALLPHALRRPASRLRLERVRRSRLDEMLEMAKWRTLPSSSVDEVANALAFGEVVPRDHYTAFPDEGDMLIVGRRPPAGG